MKQDFSFTVSGLDDYVNNNVDAPLILKEIFKGRSIDTFTPVLANTGDNRLNVLDVSTELGDGLVCDPDAAGGATFTQRTLTATPVQVTKAYCAKDFFKKWQSQLAVTQLGEMPLEETITEAELQEIAKANEKAVWLGDTAGGSPAPFTDLFDGILEIIATAEVKEASSISEGSPGVHVDTIIDIIDEMMDETDSDILTSDLILYMGPDAFMTLVRALRKVNAFASDYHAITGDRFRLIHPYYPNLEVVATDGLATTDKFVLTLKGNIYYPIPENADDITVEWNPGSGKDKNVYFLANYLMGVQIGRPEYVTVNWS